MAGLVGGGIVWWRRRKQKTDGIKPMAPDRAKPKPGPTPSDPPRPMDLEDTAPRGHWIGTADLSDDFRATLDELFPEAWPPDDTTVDSLA